MNQIDAFVCRALRITIPAALIMLALCIGITTGSHTKIVYRQMPQQNGVYLLASAISSTPALKPFHHGR